jgi:hypothetical protein
MNTFATLSPYLSQTERLALCDGRSLPVVLSPADIGPDNRAECVTVSTPRFPLGTRPARALERVYVGGMTHDTEDGAECEEIEEMEGEEETSVVRPAYAYNLPSRGSRSSVMSELRGMGYAWND